MTLKTQIKSDFAAIMLNTDEFAELVTVYPSGGGPSREITAICERTREDDPRRSVKADLDELRLECLKDEDHAKGGISQASIDAKDIYNRLRVRPNDEPDTDTSKYVFTGTIDKEEDSHWTLIFSRSKKYRVGNGHRTG